MGIVTEVSAELSDFVQKMGESVASAKRQIDRASLEALQELAKADVTLPIVTKTIENGKVTYTTQKVTVSPLSLGMTPSFYEFQKTDIEVSMDFEITEDTTQSSSSSGRTKNKFPKIGKIGVNTKRVRQERKIKSDLKGYSSLKIEMVPVPPPNSIPDLFIDDTVLRAIDNRSTSDNDPNA